MTVSSITPVNNYTGNSSSRKFDFDFLIEDTSELRVQHKNQYGVITILTEGVDYSINEIGNPEGSYITFPLQGSSYNVLAEDESISLILDLTIKQESEFGNSLYFDLHILERTFDYIVRILQIFARKFELCLQVDEGPDSDPDDLLQTVTSSMQQAIEAAEDAAEYAQNADNSATAAQNSAEDAASTLSTAVSDINSAKEAALSSVTVAKESAVSDVNTAKTGAESELTTEKNSAISALNSVKTQAVSEISDLKNQAKDWAVKTDGTVSDGEFSAKYYAEKAHILGSVSYEEMKSANAYLQNNNFVSQDAEGYQCVNYYAHSTYDSSKFTTHGTVSVTDDGIASGFSASNYLTFTAKCGNVTMQVVKFNVSSLPSSVVPIGVNTYFTTSLQYVGGSLKHFPMLKVNDGNNNFSLRTSTVNIQANTDYMAVFTYNSTTYELGVYLYDGNGTLLDSKTNTSSYNIVLPTSQTTFAMGYNNNSANLILDLKQVYMISDGIPVFSGNKTGVDTIKADNYTVVGTPTISSDGVATNFSASNNITSHNKFTIDVSKDFEVRLKLRNVLYQDGLGDTGVLCFKNVNSNATRFSLRYNGKAFYLVSGGSGNNSGSTGNRYWTYDKNFDIDVVFGLKGTSFYGKFKRSYNDNWITLDTTTIDLTDDFGESYISIGTAQPNFMTDSTGSIDLNSVKIYVDSDLVYQPCLKIPYAESKTGSKVADVVYRDRVIDMYEQFGDAPYYTIDEVNRNFTLPQGEIYGMIQKNSDDISDLNTGKADINLSDITADGKKTVMGWCVPDFANGIEVQSPSTVPSSATNTYTAPSAGWIYFEIFGGQSGYIDSIKINNINVGSSLTIPSASEYRNNFGYYVEKNDVLNWTQPLMANIVKIIFYPLKGAN